MHDVAEALDAVRRRIAAATETAGRAPGSVELLAVSKTHPPERVRAAAAAGQRRFGENYLQDAMPKMAALADLDLEWHFIGHLQSNKSRPVAEHFQWVHTLDRLKLARRLSEQRPPGLPDLQVCLQVNVSAEASKAGARPEDLAALAEAVAGLPRLRLRGLMTLPAPTPDAARQRRAFRRLRVLQEGLIARGLELDTLSMGMTADLESAIAEGATLVRVGTGIFGPRGGAKS